MVSCVHEGGKVKSWFLEKAVRVCFSQQATATAGCAVNSMAVDWVGMLRLTDRIIGLQMIYIKKKPDDILVANKDWPELLKYATMCYRQNKLPWIHSHCTVKTMVTM